MFRARSLAASTIAWTIGAASSVGIGLIALTMIGTGFGNGPLQPLSPKALDPPAVAGTADPSPSASASPTAKVSTIVTAGGNAFIQCGQSGAYVYGWAAAPGYRTDDVRRGPASVVTITFKSDQHEVNIAARCSGTSVVPSIRNDDRGHGHGD